MRPQISTALLWLAAALLTFDGVMHGILWGAGGVRTIQAAIGVAPGFNKQFGADLQVLWIADIVNLLSVAGVCALAALSPRFAAPAVLLIVALIPLALAVLLFAAHSVWWVPAMQLAATALVVSGAVLRFGVNATPSS
jgi:hypothetical protein